MLRYAILHHQPTGGEPHFDLLFETAPGSMLATWRLPAWPVEGNIAVTRIKDHRRIYLDYEGEITGGSGYVTRVAGGACDVASDETEWTVRLNTGVAPQMLILRNGGHPDIWELSAHPAGGSSRSTAP